MGDHLDDVEGFFIDFSSRHTSAGSGALLAVLAVDRGKDAAARSELIAVTERLENLPKDMDWLLCLCLSAEVAHALGETATAARLYPLLAPYERRCALIAGAVGFAGSVAHYLGLLAATLGRLEQAEAHFATAAAMHADMGARPWLARTHLAHGRSLLGDPGHGRAERGAALVAQASNLAEELGMAGLLGRLPDGGPPMTSPMPEVATLRHEGARWSVRYGSSQFELADAKGLHYLARLLALPGQEVHALDLAGGPTGRTVAEGDAGAILDAKAKASYRSRFESLREDLEEAEAWGDEERAFRARTEMDAIAGELAAAVGLAEGTGGRALPPTALASASERRSHAFSGKSRRGTRFSAATSSRRSAPGRTASTSPTRASPSPGRCEEGTLFRVVSRLQGEGKSPEVESCTTSSSWVVSIVDADRIWFKSHHGLDVDQIDREPGLCASAILHDGPWLVNDARVDPRTLANPLVAGEMGVGFYAGVPLTTHDGYSLAPCACSTCSLASSVKLKWQR